MQTKMSVRAYKLSIPALKRICDVFDVDRTKKTTKDDLIDCLLDFLGNPDIKLTNAEKADGKTKAMSSKQANKKMSKEEEDSDEDGSDEDEEESEQNNASDEDEKGKMPSDKALRKWVRAYIACFNLEKVTTKHALETVSDKFGVDLSSKKDQLKELLTDAL
jgi:TATA-binding protein-associated factor Taf7